jgi:hypothetical protein
LKQTFEAYQETQAELVVFSFELANTCKLVLNWKWLSLYIAEWFDAL